MACLHGRGRGLCLGAALAIAVWVGAARADSPIQVHSIDETKTVELAGNVRPEARIANDRGRIADDTALDHMQLLLKRDPRTEAALEAFLDSLQDEASPNYHKFLTAAQFGERFGPARQDIATVTAWMTSHGFVVNGVSAGHTFIDFSGTAGQVREAFHTDMHRLAWRGESHIANMSNPRIPQALSAVVAGVVSLNDFRPHPLHRPRPAYSVSVDGSTYYAVVPGDLAKIYNFTPVFTAGISGQGQTIVVIEDSNIYSAADFTAFRAAFGLSGYTSGKLTETHPGGSFACGNPGVIPGDEVEAELDMEWASAAAPSATIDVASCANTATSFGGLLALQNLINAKTPPAIVSISFGECEAWNGATQNAAYSSSYQQAAALGVSVYVSAGDWGAAFCDAGGSTATLGLNVNGLASTRYNVAVGGTDFADSYARTTNMYWGSVDTATYGSAKSYIPEIPWNDSCASQLISAYLGYVTPWGSWGLCNSFWSTFYGLHSINAGSGGQSRCATGAPSVSGMVSGTCHGYAKPSWQTVLGNPADALRDLPDIALFAGDGIWGHFYIYCDSDLADGGAFCAGAPINWSGSGGTSFAAPVMAGVQALINQKHGAQGNPNPTLYRLASAEYGAAGSAICNASRGNSVGGSCVFYDITLGDEDVVCAGAHNCYAQTGTYGVLSGSNTAYAPAYKAGLGWDFATGLGSINVSNLMTAW
jgi:subtilase family serine protease